MAELKLDIFVSNLNKLKKQFEGIKVGGNGAAAPGAAPKSEAKKTSKGILGMAAGIGGMVGIMYRRISSERKFWQRRHRSLKHFFEKTCSIMF